MKDKLDELLAELRDIANEQLMSEVEVPEGLEQRLEKFVQNLEELETPEISFEPKKQKGFATTSFFRRYAIAACASLIFVLGISLHFLFQPEQEFVFKDTCKTPEEAEMQLARALTILGTHTANSLECVQEQIDRVSAQPDYSRFITFE